MIWPSSLRPGLDPPINAIETFGASTCLSGRNRYRAAAFLQQIAGKEKQSANKSQQGPCAEFAELFFRGG
jgi:hypothetical protein